MKLKEFDLSSWVLINSIFWSLGFASGLMAGFLVPVIGDVIAVILFTSLVLYFQYRILAKSFTWGLEFIKKSTIGFFVGLTISFIFTLVFDDFIGLTLAHILAFPIVITGAVWFQFRELQLHYSNAKNWLLVNLIIVVISYVLLALLNIIFDFRFDLLDVRDRDFSAVFPWLFVGLIIGSIYGLLSGLILSKHWLVLDLES